MPESETAQVADEVYLDTPTLLAVMVQLCTVAVIELTKSRKGDLAEIRADLLRLLSDLNCRISAQLPTQGSDQAGTTSEE